MLRRSASLALLFAVTAFAVTGCTHNVSPPQSANDTLTFTVVPYEAADKLSEDYGAMTTYLARKIGKPHGRFTAVTDYAGVLAALKSGEVDVAYLSPLPYALATSQMAVTPLAMPYVKGTLSYYGIIFTRADSPVKTLQDLKGRTLAFGDPVSTSGYLLPRLLLEKNGIPLTSLKHYYNAGDANTVVAAVENRTADAGAAYNLVFLVAYKEHPEKARLMRTIARTEDIPNGIYVARPGLPAAEVDALKRAFMEMNTDPEGRAAMLRAPNDKVVPPDDRLFEGVRRAATAAGIDVTALDKKK